MIALDFSTWKDFSDAKLDNRVLPNLVGFDRIRCLGWFFKRISGSGGDEYLCPIAHLYIEY